MNTSKSLDYVNGRLTEDFANMEKITTCFFAKFFTSKGGVNLRDHILSGVGKCITNEANFHLTVSYTKEEVCEALKVMGSIKLLDINGFFVIFLQR